MASPEPTRYTALGKICAGRWDHALARFAREVGPGQCLQMPAPSLAALDARGAYPLDVSAAAAAVGGVTPQDWASNAGFDPVRQRFWWSGGRPYNVQLPQMVLHYDAVAERFVGRENAWPKGGHIYQSHCTAPELRQHFKLPYGDRSVLYRWDIDSDARIFPDIAVAVGGAALNGTECLVWHPRLGAQGSILLASETLNRLARFDWATQAWSVLSQGVLAFASGHLSGHYNAAAGVAIIGRGHPDTPRPLARVDSDGTVTQSAPAPCYLHPGGGSARGVFAPHPRRRASIAFCMATARIWSYEFDADAWVDRAPLPAPLNHTTCIGATVPQLGVIVHTRYGAAGTSSMWVYRPDF